MNLGELGKCLHIVIWSLKKGKEAKRKKIFSDVCTNLPSRIYLDCEYLGQETTAFVPARNKSSQSSLGASGELHVHQWAHRNGCFVTDGDVHRMGNTNEFCKDNCISRVGWDPMFSLIDRPFRPSFYCAINELLLL